MKKPVVLLILFSILSLSFVSCNGDDNDAETDLIIGKWQWDKVGGIINGGETLIPYDGDCSSKKDNIEVKAGGALKTNSYNSDCSLDSENGNWTKNGNSFTFGIGTNNITWDILTLDSTTLKIAGYADASSDFKSIIEFKRI